MKNIILVVISIIVFLFVIFVIVFGFIEIPKQLENQTERSLQKISKDLINGNIKFDTVKNLPESLFFAVWLKNSSGVFIPIIYDKNYSYFTEKNPMIFKDNNFGQVIIFKKSVLKFDYIVWANKFKTDYYVKNILIPVLIIILLYLIIVIIVSFSFGLKRDITPKNNKIINEDLNTPMSYELSSEEFNGLLGNEDEDENENNFTENEK
ncbi:MAG TPA: hypothetical protein PK771_14545, partial [Spirochaetota bacterium]|nr:hypothetical protein [Spirochaetota bacterium]